MTQPYPSGFQGPGFVAVPPQPRFRPLRQLGIAAIALIAGTAVLTCVHTALFWTAFDSLEVDLAEAVNDENADGLADALQQTMANGMLTNITSLVSVAAAVVFLIWLWQARENSEVLSPTYRHRLAKGWSIGSWFCPGVQFWFPLTIVDDVYRASAEPPKPGMVGGVRGRGLVFGWWAAWALYWLCVLVGSVIAFFTVVSWLIALSDASEAGGTVDEVTIRADIVRFVRGLAIGFGVSSGLIVIAGVLVCLVIWRVTAMQDARGPVAHVPGLQAQPYGPYAGPYAGPQLPAPPTYPTYGRPQDRPQDPPPTR
jgi:hypothetical protein